jgi:hypothetical protein
MTTYTDHGLRSYEQVRRVDMDQLTPRTRERMLRHHAYLEYQEVGKSLAGGGSWSFQRDKAAGGLTLQEFLNNFHNFMLQRTTGFYQHSRGGDPNRGRIHVDVWFELESDFELFQRDFVMPLKLAAN